MAAYFFEGKKLPKDFRRMSHYARASRGMGDGNSDQLNAVANIVSAASPWNLLTGLFVGKPEMEAQQALEAQQSQIQAATDAAAQRAGVIQTMIFAGAGLAGVALLAIMLKAPSHPPAVHGYRKRRSRR